MTSPKKKKESPSPQPERARPIEERPDASDAIDEASRESFPASDPPAGQPLHPGRPGKHPDRDRR